MTIRMEEYIRNKMALAREEIKNYTNLLVAREAFLIRGREDAGISVSEEDKKFVEDNKLTMFSIGDYLNTPDDVWFILEDEFNQDNPCREFVEYVMLHVFTKYLDIYPIEE